MTGKARTLCLCAAAASILFAPAALEAQVGSMSGRIVEAGTGAVISGVVVHVAGVARSGLTGAEGRFLLTGIPAGERVLIAEHIGHATTRRTVVVRVGATEVADLEMELSAIPVSDIVVTASREAQRRVETPVAIGVVQGSTLRARRPNHPAEVLNAIPGVMVRVTNGEGHMTAIRHPITTDAVYLYLEDGIPTRSTGFFNHNALYEVNLPQADRIEVSKGPATALYGSDAIGGVVNVSTRAPSAEPEATISLDGGRFGWGRMLLTGSSTFGRTGLRADLNLTRTDGWRDSTAYTRQSGTVRWDQSLGSNAALKTVATFSRIDQQSEASSISESDYDDTPTVNYSPFARRQVKAFRLSTAFQRLGTVSSFEATPYLRYDWMRLIPNWTVSYDPSDYTTQNRSVGMLLKYRRDFEPLGARLIVGADVDWSPGSQVEKQTATSRSSGGPIYSMTYTGATLYDYDVTYHGVSEYAQLELSPLPALRLNVGVRADQSGYSYSNNLTPLETGRWKRPADVDVSYTHLSPKVGATYELAPELNLFASYRHGFRAPSQGQLFRQGSALATVDLEPVKVDSYEAGVRGRIAERTDYDVSVYDMVKRDDILGFTFPDGHSEAQNAGKTTHRGVEASLGAQVVPALRADVAWSYSKHLFADWKTTTSVDLSGKELVSAPRHIGSASVTFAPLSWRGAQLVADVEHLGSYWEDQANTHKDDGYTLYHVRATSPTVRGAVLSLRLLNVANTKYSTLSSYTVAQGEQLNPGQGRGVYLTAEYTLR
jgi:outer membrane receptor protein involved in Fe transport